MTKEKAIEKIKICMNLYKINNIFDDIGKHKNVFDSLRNCFLYAFDIGYSIALIEVYNIKQEDLK